MKPGREEGLGHGEAERSREEGRARQREGRQATPLWRQQRHIVCREKRGRFRCRQAEAKTRQSAGKRAGPLKHSCNKGIDWMQKHIGKVQGRRQGQAETGKAGNPSLWRQHICNKGIDWLQKKCRQIQVQVEEKTKEVKRGIEREEGSARQATPLFLEAAVGPSAASLTSAYDPSEPKNHSANFNPMALPLNDLRQCHQLC